MLLFDLKNTHTRVFKAAVFGGLVLTGIALSGCQVRPLYGTTSGEFGATSMVADDLAAIDLDSISSQFANEDAARVLYNELTFNLERGAGSPAKRYRLKVLIDVSSSDVGVEQFADVPSAYTTTMNSTFVLSDINTNETLMTGRSFKSASYDFSDQRFANQRAYRDAQERVAKSVADDITARLAGHFASRS
ncbi:hypothetical protein E1180_07090 [Roseibium denhamense]|uniref:LPS-assembly lipoprotein n=1 Tax=Roseibium denhamense TaxID=76305 RepID=A0ABY1PDC3_9HYPH|nr:hypothetical protein [Roseibium denhamense]MTI05277.1 hypothetical protein [Roseibium denhamense]SMP30563.1 LPS-assembly lipoprotein [Roseibium denhamense]